ncbi:MAG: hypothetical protein WAM66_11040 [Acidobacteriaceae bacterium]
MAHLCRHVLPAGNRCTQPALHDKLYCRHHQFARQTLAANPPPPDPHHFHTPVGLIYPEDRAALQLNYFLVMRALDNKLINTQVANAMNRILRSCEANLRHGPLIPANQQDTVTNLTLTPEGEEIAPSQQIPEEAGEEAPTEPQQEGTEKASAAEEPAPTSELSSRPQSAPADEVQRPALPPLDTAAAPSAHPASSVASSSQNGGPSRAPLAVVPLAAF